jgi:signal transduction histidine kinase
MEEITHLKILYLEDVPDDAELAQRQLRKDGIRVDMQRVDSKQEFIQAIRTHSFDVILSDHSLPQFNSSDALSICQRAHIQVPFILVTGTVSEEFAVRCLKQGADDYILKSNLTRLAPAIVNAIRQRQLELARKNAELTLRHQNEELIKINQELDSFVYSVSHNLRAPLMSVLGLLHIAKDDRSGAEALTQYLGMMESSIKKLDETLKEILDYSRNARNELNFSLIDVRGLLNDSVEKLQYLAGFDQMTMTIEGGGEGIPFHSDATRLSVVFGNLLSNAIKYRDSNKEKSQLSIRITVTERSAEVVFQDNGIGIPAALLPDIFKMFFRGTERSEGAGLGLYIVRETIEKLEGKIEVNSVHGVGTTFVMTIPNKNFA